MTTTLNSVVVFERHADFQRQSAEWRRAKRPARRRRRPRVAMRTVGQYVANGRPGQRGELHRA